jgi:hypothetical protein
MYLSMSEVLGMSIALAVAIILIIVTTIANYQLQQNNKFLRTRLRRTREHYERTTGIRR